MCTEFDYIRKSVDNALKHNHKGALNIKSPIVNYCPVCTLVGHQTMTY